MIILKQRIFGLQMNYWLVREPTKIYIVDICITSTIITETINSEVRSLCADWFDEQWFDLILCYCSRIIEAISILRDGVICSNVIYRLHKWSSKEDHYWEFPGFLRRKKKMPSELHPLIWEFPYWVPSSSD